MPLAWAAELPGSTAGTGTLTVETYQGSTLIGSRSYACTVYVPESVKPSGTLTVSVVNEGAAADWGVCIRGRSSLSYQAAVTGAYGAAVRTCRVSFSGASADGLSGTVGPAERSGSQKATAVVTDARGRSVTLTERGGGGAGLLSAGAGDGLGRTMRRGRDAADGRGVCAHSLHGAVRAVPADTTR